MSRNKIKDLDRIAGKVSTIRLEIVEMVDYEMMGVGTYPIETEEGQSIRRLEDVLDAFDALLGSIENARE